MYAFLLHIDVMLIINTAEQKPQLLYRENNYKFVILINKRVGGK